MNQACNQNQTESFSIALPLMNLLCQKDQTHREQFENHIPPKVCLPIMCSLLCKKKHWLPKSLI